MIIHKSGYALIKVRKINRKLPCLIAVDYITNFVCIFKATSEAGLEN
jgi:hypothetical protein